MAKRLRKRFIIKIVLTFMQRKRQKNLTAGIIFAICRTMFWMQTHLMPEKSALFVNLMSDFYGRYLDFPK